MSTFAPTTSSQQSVKETERENKSITRRNDLQIFLGGSCNPTTWRQNLAIPYLELNGISYYNPQIDNWTPEVVELEHHAKETAQILFFVIDDQTRSTVSLVESAFMAGSRKNIVLVIDPFISNVVGASNQSLEAYNVVKTHQKMTEASRTSNRTKRSLVCTSSSKTSSISSSQSISNLPKVESPSFISAAAHSHTSESSFISAKIESGDNDLASAEFEKTQELVHHASCSLRLAGEPISVEEYWELKLARSILKNLIDRIKIPTFADISQALNHISCHIRDTISNRISDNTLEKGEIDSNQSNSQLFQNSTYSEGESTGKTATMKDVYLSIDSDDCTIMENTVIPLLEERGLSYNFMSIRNIMEAHQLSDKPSEAIRETTQCTDDRASALDCSDGVAEDGTLGVPPNSPERAELAVNREICAIQTSRVLLFVISNKCRGLSIMVLASHFMALLRKNVVLCVQYLEEPCTIGGETLTKTAVADYNRGRVYLCDYALKSRVPVFSSIQEAIECCSRKCQHIK